MRKSLEVRMSTEGRDSHAETSSTLDWLPGVGSFQEAGSPSCCIWFAAGKMRSDEHDFTGEVSARGGRRSTATQTGGDQTEIDRTPLGEQ
jgi:hypothetical protein